MSILNRKILREMILSEVKVLRENVDPRIIARQIAERFGDMFATESMIDSQIENHVYFELIDKGYMTESKPNFDLLDEVMDELSRLGIVSEAGGFQAGAMTWLKNLVQKRPDLANADRNQRRMLAKNLQGKFPQMTDGEAFSIVKTVLDRMASGSGKADIVSLVEPFLPTEKVRLIALAKDKNKVAQLTTKLFRSDDIPDDFEPHEIKKAIMSVLIKKLGIKKEDFQRGPVLTQEGLRHMIMSELPSLSGGYQLKEHSVLELAPSRRNLYEGEGTLTDILFG